MPAWWDPSYGGGDEPPVDEALERTLAEEHKELIQLLREVNAHVVMPTHLRGRVARALSRTPASLTFTDDKNENGKPVYDRIQAAIEAQEERQVIEQCSQCPYAAGPFRGNGRCALKDGHGPCKP